MSATSLGLMVAAMGVYQGFNPSMGWLHAVSRALERRSMSAAVRGTAALAAGHYIAMLTVLLPAALLFAFVPMNLMAIQPWLGGAMIGFGLFKLYRPYHPRFLVRIPPHRPVRWSCAMALCHCGSPLMMLGPLVSVLMLLEPGGFVGPALTPRVGWFAAAAFAVPAAMVATLLLTASGVAIAVYRRFGLRALTRLWFNVDIGWAVVFLAMGTMALMMGDGVAMPGHMG